MDRSWKIHNVSYFIFAWGQAKVKCVGIWHVRFNAYFDILIHVSIDDITPGFVIKMLSLISGAYRRFGVKSDLKHTLKSKGIKTGRRWKSSAKVQWSINPPSGRSIDQQLWQEQKEWVDRSTISVQKSRNLASIYRRLSIDRRSRKSSENRSCWSIDDTHTTILLVQKSL